jgi:hypothetical protein
MDNVSIYQYVMAAVAFGTILGRTLRFFRRETSQSIPKYLTVVFVWGMIGVVSLFPSVAHWIRVTFGFGENFNTMIFIAFVVLFVLFFRILAIIEKIESQISEFIRNEALRNLQKSKKGLK